MFTSYDLCGTDFRKNGLEQHENFLLGLRFSFFYMRVYQASCKYISGSSMIVYHEEDTYI